MKMLYMSQKQKERHFRLILCLDISFIMLNTFKFEMLLDSLLEKGQSTINLSLAH